MIDLRIHLFFCTSFAIWFVHWIIHHDNIGGKAFRKLPKPTKQDMKLLLKRV